MFRTSGDVNEPIVGMVVSQIEASIENDRAGYSSFWDYRVFFTRVVRFRLLVLFLYSVFQQWNGGGIITYYVSPLPLPETPGRTCPPPPPLSNPEGEKRKRNED